MKDSTLGADTVTIVETTTNYLNHIYLFNKAMTEFERTDSVYEGIFEGGVHSTYFI